MLGRTHYFQRHWWEACKFLAISLSNDYMCSKTYSNISNKLNWVFHCQVSATLKAETILPVFAAPILCSDTDGKHAISLQYPSQTVICAPKHIAISVTKLNWVFLCEVPATSNFRPRHSCLPHPFFAVTLRGSMQIPCNFPLKRLYVLQKHIANKTKLRFSVRAPAKSNLKGRDNLVCRTHCIQCDRWEACKFFAIHLRHDYICSKTHSCIGKKSGSSLFCQPTWSPCSSY